MNILDFLMWIPPFLLWPVSYFLFRLKSGRVIRYWVWAAILFLAFLFNLTGASFRIDPFDTALLLMVSLILCEICWYLSRIKKKGVFLSLFSISMAVFICVYYRWFTIPPQSSYTLWEGETMQTYKMGSTEYRAKKCEKWEKNKTHRVFELHRMLKLSPFEMIVGSFSVPDAYGLAVFSFKWSDSAKGVRLDLVGDRDTLWTLGEGFSERDGKELY